VHSKGKNKRKRERGKCNFFWKEIGEGETRPRFPRKKIVVVVAVSKKKKWPR
jgi:hypothetical protein